MESVVVARIMGEVTLVGATLSNSKSRVLVVLTISPY